MKNNRRNRKLNAIRCKNQLIESSCFENEYTRWFRAYCRRGPVLPSKEEITYKDFKSHFVFTCSVNILIGWRPINGMLRPIQLPKKRGISPLESLVRDFKEVPGVSNVVLNGDRLEYTYTHKPVSRIKVEIDDVGLIRKISEEKSFDNSFE